MPTSACSTTCCSGRTASWSPCGRRSSRPSGRSGSRSAPGTSANRRRRATRGLDGPARGHLRPHRRRPHADLRHHARGQLRPRRVSHARHVPRLLRVHARGARPVRRAADLDPDLLRRGLARLRAHHAGRHPRLAQRADLHHGRAVHRAAERRPRAVDRRLPRDPPVALVGRPARGRHRVQPLAGGGVGGRRRADHRAVRLHEVDAHGPRDARHRPGPGRGHADGHRHRPRVPPHLRHRHRVRGRGGRARLAALRGLPAGGAAVRDARVRRGRPRRSRRHGRRHGRQPHRGRRRGGRLVRLRRGVERSLLLPALHRRARLPSGRALRAARRRDPRRMTRLAPDRWTAVALFAAAATPLVTRDTFMLDSVILILLWGSLSAGWNVAGGYAGQVSLGHAAFFGIGAYAAALMSARHLNPWLGLAIGVGLSIGAGGLIGYLSNRLKGPYFALSTIAFAEVLKIVASRWRGFTAGSEGVPVPFRPGFATLGLGHVAWLYLILVLALVCYALQMYLERSRVGYQLAGVREDEDAAEALGIATRRRKVQAVVLSAALTSMGGSLWAQYVGFVDPSHVFSIDLSVRFALNSIIGGMGTALGPFLGSLLITSLETYLRATFSGIQAGFTGIYLIIYGVVLILIVRFAPEGVTGIAARWRTRRDRAHA